MDARLQCTLTISILVKRFLLTQSLNSCLNPFHPRPRSHKALMEDKLALLTGIIFVLLLAPVVVAFCMGKFSTNNPVPRSSETYKGFNYAVDNADKDFLKYSDINYITENDLIYANDRGWELITCSSNPVYVNNTRVINKITYYFKRRNING